MITQLSRHAHINSQARIRAFWSMSQQKTEIKVIELTEKDKRINSQSGKRQQVQHFTFPDLILTFKDFFPPPHITPMSFEASGCYSMGS